MTVISELPSEDAPKAREEILSACRRQCQDYPRMLRDIDQFELEYTKHKCIEWYTKSTFVYKLINRALRSEDIVQLYQYRYFIADLSRALASKSKTDRIDGSSLLHLYRGGSLTPEDARRFNDNIGRRIAVNSYWSTSRNLKCARTFAYHAPDENLLAVMFSITIDQNGSKDSFVYADISYSSQFQTEEEILFDVGSIFEITGVTKEGNGSDEMYHVELKGVGNPSSDSQFHINEMRAEMSYESPRMLIGILLKRLGKYEDSLRYFEELLQNGAENDAAYIHNRLGIAWRNKNEDEKALNHFNEALKFYSEKCLSDRKLLAAIHHNIGIIQSKRKKFTLALSSYTKAIKSIEEDRRDMRRFEAELYGSISRLYLTQRENEEAKVYLDKAQKLREGCLPKDHYIHAFTHADLAHYYYNKYRVRAALHHHREALRIRRKSLPQDHVNTAWSLYYVGRMHYTNGASGKALSLYEQSVAMYKKCLPLSQCRQVPKILLDMAKIYRRMNDNEKVSQCYQEAREIQQQAGPYSHIYLDNICRKIQNLLR